MARFAAGNPGGPGRPPGSWSGRRRALQIIDEVLADAGNADALRDALQTRFDADPVAFWLQLGAPLLPREAKLELLTKAGDQARELYLEVCAAVGRGQEGRGPLDVSGDTVINGTDADTPPPTPDRGPGRKGQKRTEKD